MQKITNTIKQTHKVAEDLVKKIYKLRNHKRAVVVALVGDLGAGKTTFIQGFGKALGVKEQVTSPTFVIMKKFIIHNSKFKILIHLIHIDAYRINLEDLESLGWQQLLKDPGSIILIEWANRIKKILPKKYFLLNFEHKGEKKRAIDISLVT